MKKILLLFLSIVNIEYAFPNINGEPINTKLTKAPNGGNKAVYGRAHFVGQNKRITVIECKRPKDMVCIYIIKKVADNSWNDICKVTVPWNPDNGLIDNFEFFDFNYAYAVADSLPLVFIPCNDINISCPDQNETISIQIVH
jgi:hypothetical protein